MHPVAARSVLPPILPTPTSNIGTDGASPQASQGNAPTGAPRGHKASTESSDRSPPVLPVQLSAGDLDALQSVDNGTAGHGKSAQSPAHQARAFIADHPEFAGIPFGHVVSQFAHGQTPVVDTTGDGTTPTDTGSVTPPVDGSTPPADTAGTPPVDNSTPPTDTSGVPPTDVANTSPSDTTDTSTTTPTDTAGTPPVDSTTSPTDTPDVPPTDTASTTPADTTTTASDTTTPADTTTTDVPSDSTLPSDPVPNVAVTDPDQALIDALT